MNLIGKFRKTIGGVSELISESFLVRVCSMFLVLKEVGGDRTQKNSTHTEILSY